MDLLSRPDFLQAGNSDFFQNFERPFLARTKLGLAWNFGKMRFGRFATFQFRRQKKFFGKKFAKHFRMQGLKESGVLEELWIFDPRWQMRRKKLFPELPLFLGRLPWRRGKQLNLCFGPWLGTKNDLDLLDQKWLRPFGPFGTKVVQFIRTAIRTVPFSKGNVAQELRRDSSCATLPFAVLVLR